MESKPPEGDSERAADWDAGAGGERTQVSLRTVGAGEARVGGLCISLFPKSGNSTRGLQGVHGVLVIRDSGGKGR